MKSRVLFLLLSVTLLLAVGLGLASARTPGRQLLDAQRAVSAPDDSPVVVAVNGAEITRGQMQAAVDMAQAVMSAYTETLSADDLYRILLGRMVLNTAIYQQAAAEGLTASEAEAQAQWDFLQSNAQNNPVLQAYFERLSALPQAEQERIRAQIIAGYRRALVAGKWYQRIRESVPEPTDEEIARFLQNTPAYRNLLVVTGVAVDEYADARKLYRELKDTLQSEGAVHALAALEAQPGLRPASGEALSQTFHFIALDELPPYAQEAAATQPGTLHLFANPDGGGIVYFTEQVSYQPHEALYRAAAQALREQRQEELVAQRVAEVLNEADIRVFRVEGVPYVPKETLLANIQADAGTSGIVP